MPTLRLLPELEQALRQVPGIRAASVVTGPDAVPTEIHIVANHAKGAKQVVRDVQSLALAAHGIDIDHRIISVVQFDDGEDALPAVIRLPDTPVRGRTSASEHGRGPASEHGRGPASEQGRGSVPDAVARPSIASISIRTAGSEADASVVVSAGDESYEGRSIGPSSMSHRYTLVARATLDAVGELLGLPAEIEVATVTAMGSRQMAACVIQVAVPRVGELVLTGSALVRGDEADAVARAVLDALNRRLAG